MTAAFWDAVGLMQSLGPEDVVLVIGTSCAVAPANLLPYAALSRGCRAVEINLERCLADELPPQHAMPAADDVIAKPLVELGHLRDFAPLITFIGGPAGTVLPALCARVRALRESSQRL